MTVAASGGNDLAAKAETFIRRIEEIDDELDSEKGAYVQIRPPQPSPLIP